jgi:hypothetical protein
MCQSALLPFKYIFFSNRVILPFMLDQATWAWTTLEVLIMCVALFSLKTCLDCPVPHVFKHFSEGISSFYSTKSYLLCNSFLTACSDLKWLLLTSPLLFESLCRILDRRTSLGMGIFSFPLWFKFVITGLDVSVCTCTEDLRLPLILPCFCFFFSNCFYHS